MKVASVLTRHENVFIPLGSMMGYNETLPQP